jgi:hypothetical protein
LVAQSTQYIYVGFARFYESAVFWLDRFGNIKRKFWGNIIAYLMRSSWSETLKRGNIQYDGGLIWNHDHGPQLDKDVLCNASPVVLEMKDRFCVWSAECKFANFPIGRTQDGNKRSLSRNKVFFSLIVRLSGQAGLPYSDTRKTASDNDGGKRNKGSGISTMVRVTGAACLASVSRRL